MAHALELYNRRKKRTRSKLSRVSNGKVRLSVFRSGKHIYAQVIDDAQRRTLCAASTLDKSLDMAHGSTTQAAEVVGRLIGERAIALGITTVVFDRGGYLYHGRVKSLAEAARAAGLKF